MVYTLLRFFCEAGGGLRTVEDCDDHMVNPSVGGVHFVFPRLTMAALQKFDVEKMIKAVSPEPHLGGGVRINLHN